MLCPLQLDIDALAIGSPWPIDEALIERHCRIDDDDDAALLEMYLRAAISWAENTTHRTIFNRPHRWVLKEFPYHGREVIRLPRGKTSSVSVINYVAGRQARMLKGPTSGSPGGIDYQEDLGSDDGGALMPPQGGCWPSVDCDAIRPVEIEFNAGWQPDEVPADIVHALVFAMADAFDLRLSEGFTGANSTSARIASAGTRLGARESLISPYILSRWY